MLLQGTAKYSFKVHTKEWWIHHLPATGRKRHMSHQQYLRLRPLGCRNGYRRRQHSHWPPHRRFGNTVLHHPY